MLITHLQSGNSYGIQLKEKHCKFPQPELGPWVEGSKTVGTDYKPPVLEGWEPPRTEHPRRARADRCGPGVAAAQAPRRVRSASVSPNRAA